MAVLKVQVVSRESVVWSGEATYVRARTTEGQIGIMPGHMPTMALLSDDGELVIDPREGERKIARLHEGFLTVSNDRVTIAASSAEL